MSGFIAVYHRSGRPVNLQLLELLTKRLSRRGPDGWGVWSSGPIGMGRSLLQTTREIETVPGPIAFDGIHLAGDVRLDDRDGLGRRLRSAGSPLDSGAPDIELLLHAYRLWGESCLDEIAGDFAFALWDSRENRLIAARDHFGIVPLYYAEAGEALLIGNSLPCILAHPDVDGALSEDAVADYLAVGRRMRRSGTCYKGVSQLEPGHILRASPGDLRTSAYWRSTEDGPDIRYRRPAEYVERFREIFDSAVGDRLRCDRASTHLSGGMDASSIAVTMARQYGQATAGSMRAYTYYFRDLIADDEGELSREIAAASKIPFESIEIEPILDASEGRVPRHLPPEPSIVTNSSPARTINERAALHGRVLFMGFGGDPLFGGAATLPGSIRSLLRPIRFSRDFLYCYRLHGQRPRFGMHALKSVQRHPAPERFLDADFAAGWDVEGRRREWLLAARASGLQSMATDPLWTGLFNAADPDFTGLPLKARFPFFDLRLFRYLNRIPELPWSGDKMLLRLAMIGTLPEGIRRRSKTGLRGNPWRIRLRRNGPQPWMFDLLAMDALQPYVNRDAAVEILRHPGDWDNTTFSRFWYLLNFAHWLRDRPVAIGRHC